MRLLPLLPVAATCALLAPDAGAAKPARACIDAHAEGQMDRDAGRLLRARDRFWTCAAESCPALIRKECGALNAAMAPQIPSVVLSAQDANGAVIAGAQATVDHQRSVPASGAALEVDPGQHHIEIALADGRRQTFVLSLARAERLRRVVARFDTTPAPPPKPRASSNDRLAYALGGAGLLALGGWAAFALDGLDKQSDLEKCAPECSSRSEVRAMRRSYLVADVLLGVSLISLGSSAYLLLGSADSSHAGRQLVVGASGRF